MIVATPDHVSLTFSRTRKNGNYRMILSLKTFNGFLKFKHEKLESVKDALDLLTEGCYFGSVKLKDISYTIPIHENHQKYLKLLWKEEYYQYIVLTNGFSPAHFHHVLIPPFKCLRIKRFPIHPKKSVLGLSQQTIFLAFVINSFKMTITQTEERKQSIYTLCQNILSNY